MNERPDLRLVPAALTAWAVTAAGICWDIGAVLTGVCLAVGAGAGALWCALPRERETARVAGAVVAAAAVVGMGFSVAVNLRSTSVRQHPVVERFGSAATVTVVPSESPLTIGGVGC